MGERKAEEIFTDFLSTMDNIVKETGLTFPTWNRNRTAGYNAQACEPGPSEKVSYKYTSQIEGEGSPDPRVAVKKMIAYFESQGYTIGNIFDFYEKTEGKGIILNATTPTGMDVRFSPSTFGSSISVISDCSADPKIRDTTT